MTSRADALWAKAFAGAAEPEEASDAWTEELEPEMARYHDGPMRKAQAVSSFGEGEPSSTGDTLSADLDFGSGTQAAEAVDAPGASAASAPAASGAVSGPSVAGGGGSGGGEVYARPDGFFPDFSDFSFADIDLVNVLDIDIDLTVEMIQNVFIDIDVGDGATLLIDSLADLIPEQNFDAGALDAAVLDFASLFGGGSAANGMMNPNAMLDSFADLGGSGLFGADIDVTNITDIDITTDITLIQNLVIDIDLGEGATLVFGDGIEDQLDELGIVLDIDQAGDPAGDPADAPPPLPLVDDGPQSGFTPDAVADSFGCA